MGKIFLLEEFTNTYANKLQGSTILLLAFHFAMPMNSSNTSQFLKECMPKELASLSPHDSTAKQDFIKNHPELWNCMYYAKRLSNPTSSPSTPTSISLSPNNSLVALGKENGSITIWDIRNQEPYIITIHCSKQPIYQMQFSLNEKTLLIKHNTKMLSAIDISPIESQEYQQDTLTYPRISPIPLPNEIDSIQAFFLSSTESYIFIANNKAAYLLEKSSCKMIKKIPFSNQQEKIIEVTISPNEKFFAILSEKGTVDIWNKETDKKQTITPTRPSSSYRCSFSSCNNFIHIASTQEIKCYELQEYQRIRHFRHRQLEYPYATLSPCTNLSAWIQYFHLYLFRHDSKQVLLPDEKVIDGTMPVALSLDGSILATKGSALENVHIYYTPFNLTVQQLAYLSLTSSSPTIPEQELHTDWLRIKHSLPKEILTRKSYFCSP